jgi:CRISPR-associated protein Csx16
MTTIFVSRHPGAVEWAKRQKLAVSQFVPHLDWAQVQPGDTVIGSLPVNLAAHVCASGAAYWHVSVIMPADMRGRELSATDLERLGAQVQAFEVKPQTLHESGFRQAHAMIARLIPPGVSLMDELIADRRAENVRDEQN